MVFENIENKVSLKDSVKLVIKNASVLWKNCDKQKVIIDHCEEKLEKEYLEWQQLNQYKHKNTDLQIKKRGAFIAKLDREFDIRLKQTTETPVTDASDSLDTISKIEEEDIPLEMVQSEEEVSGKVDAKKSGIAIKTRAQIQRTSEINECKLQIFF